MRYLGLALALSLLGCTTDELKIVSAIEATAPIACDAVAGVDPSVMTIVCAVIDDADQILVPLTPVTAPAASARAFVAIHPSLTDKRLEYARGHVTMALKALKALQEGGHEVDW